MSLHVPLDVYVSMSSNFERAGLVATSHWPANRTAHGMWQLLQSQHYVPSHVPPTPQPHTNPQSATPALRSVLVLNSVYISTQKASRITHTHANRQVARHSCCCFDLGNFKLWSATTK
eukprot:11173732-Lingulodinium_polyedra.AAC.1